MCPRPNTPGDQLKIGGTVSCTVEQVIEASGATAIPDGKFIMSISNKSGEWLQETIRSLQVGDTVDINISSEDTRWNNVQHAVGAMYWILKDGKVDTSISDGASAPRTAGGSETGWQRCLLYHRRPPERPERRRPPFKWWPSGSRSWAVKTRFFWTAAVLPRWFLRIPTSVHPLPSTAPQREPPALFPTPSSCCPT